MALDVDVYEDVPQDCKALMPAPKHAHGFQVLDCAEGDPDSGVQPGTPFEALPNDWICPDCGAGKDMFEKMD